MSDKFFNNEARLAYLSDLWLEDKEKAIKLSWEWIKVGKFDKREYKILLEQFAKNEINSLGVKE